MKTNTQTKGFTLVELLIVISIIALLTGIIIAKISGSKQSANYLKRLNDINQVDLALQRYNAANYGKYPTTSGSWYSSATCVAQSATVSATAYVPSVVPTYIASLPADADKALDCLSGPVYMYKSNGRDYKLIVYNDVKDKAVLLQKNSSMVDPARGATTTTPSFGIWTSGAIGW